MKILLSIFISTALFTMCSSVYSQAVSAADVSEIRLDTADGFCADCERVTTLRDDGTATFRGGKNSRVRKGDFSGQISKAEFTRLAKTIVEAGFLDFKTRYEGRTSDVATIEITVLYSGGRKTVENFKRSDEPKLKLVEEAFNATADRIKWRNDAEAFGPGAAQNKQKPAATDDKPFSVSCAKALRIGLSAVENLYMKDMDRRTRGETDSDTEGEAMENALKNYIPCRRADNAAKLITFTAADEKAEVERQEAAAKQLARQRFDGLIYCVSWNEKGDDLFDYQMTLRALALVEDYKGALIKSYAADVKPKTNAVDARGRRNEKVILEMLIGLETSYIVDAENAQTHKRKIAEFKTAVNRFSQENSDRNNTEREITANFIIKLIKLGLWKNWRLLK